MDGHANSITIDSRLNNNFLPWNETKFSTSPKLCTEHAKLDAIFHYYQSAQWNVGHAKLSESTSWAARSQIPEKSEALCIISNVSPPCAALCSSHKVMKSCTQNPKLSFDHHLLSNSEVCCKNFTLKLSFSWINNPIALPSDHNYGWLLGYLVTCKELDSFSVF